MGGIVDGMDLSFYTVHVKPEGSGRGVEEPECIVRVVTAGGAEEEVVDEGVVRGRGVWRGRHSVGEGVEEDVEIEDKEDGA